MPNLSRQELLRLLRKGELWCSCADAEATRECVENCHVLLDATTREVVSARAAWD